MNSSWKEPRMLVFAAAVLFGLGFLINATAANVPAVFDPISLLLLGLTCLALHHAGVGTAWRVSSSRSRSRRR
jgi:hypothetical protein